MSNKPRLTKHHLYLLLAIFVLLVFCNAQIMQTKMFAYGFAFALIANNFYSIVVIIFYFLFSFILDIAYVAFVNVAFSSALMIIFYIICKATKKQNTLIMLICCVLSRIANIYFSFVNVQSLLYASIDLVVGIGFCYICFRFVKALLLKGVQAITKTEKIFFCIMLTALFCGIANINFATGVSKFVFVLTILLCSLVLKSKTVFVACFISIAHVLTGHVALSGLSYFVLACVSAWLSPFNKFLSASMVCLADALLGLFMGYNLIVLLPVLVAAVVFVAIPKKLVTKMYNYVNLKKSNIINSFYISKRQENIKKKLMDMSGLFKQMQKCYRDLIVGQSSKEHTAQLFATELKLALCENCINKLACQDKNLTSCFEDLILRVQTKGKVNLLDVPPLLTSNCNKINACLSNVNQMATELAKQTKIEKEADDNKQNISLQLGGTSKIFQELSNQFCKQAKANINKSIQIKECLQNKGIICTECLATEDNNGVNEVIMIVRNADAVNPNILLVCEKVYNTKFERYLCFQTKVAGWSLISVVPSNRYELACGFASQAKNVDSKSGDNYVYTKLTDSKYLIAICDGMGHGEQANNISTLAINLIESYYKCGLSSQIVLDSVNAILLPVSEQGFSTLDACIVDTISGEVDFIKIGSTISLIKQTDKTFMINVESLPLGVLNNVAPSTYKTTLFAGNIVVLASDGIVDAFSSHEEFCNFVNNENVINMQLFAESILEEASSRTLSHKDDMSVIAIRLMQKK